MLDILKRLEEQVALLGAELRAAQVELADLESQCDGGQGCVSTLTAECNAPAAGEVTRIGNLQASEIAFDALPPDVPTARCRANRMDADLITLHTAFGDCLGASNLCPSTILSAVHSLLGPFMSILYQAYREIMMSLRGDKDSNVDSTMGVVHGKLLGASMVLSLQCV